MASGTPVIALARGAAPELVTEGVTGFLVHDIDGMTSAVARVAAIDAWACAHATRARFSPSTMAASYVQVYEQVIGSLRVLPEPAQVRTLLGEAVLAGLP